MLPRADVPPQPPEGHAVRRRADPLAVRRICARLKKGEPIDKLLVRRLFDDFARICRSVRVRALYDGQVPHGPVSATPFALEVMKHMNDACEKWKAGDDHRLRPLRHAARDARRTSSQSASSAASASSRASRTRAYITNSYHVHVTEHIDAFEKLQLRVAVPGAFHRRRDQLRRGAEHAEQPRSRAAR